ncbi:hypothetical protein OROHE_015886 [Orobanche hederae]
MNQDYPRPSPKDGDVGSTINSIATSFSHPLPRPPANSDHQALLIDVGPENYSSDGEDEIPAAPLTGDCVYSRPFLFIDMMWSSAFVLVSVFVLLATVNERPSTPLRLWVSGYGLQCLLHVGFVWDEYRRRSLDDDDDDESGGRNFHFRLVTSFSGLNHKSIIKKLESVNTIVSSVWWVFGFYWIVIGGQPLLQDSPRLYWLSVVFLAFDVFFMIFCVAMACIIFILLFCCFPILATVAYAMTIRDGASENDIRYLPKYIYRQKNTAVTSDKRQVVLTAAPGNSISASEIFLNPEDSLNAAYAFISTQMESSCVHFHATIISTIDALPNGFGSTLPAPFANSTFSEATCWSDSPLD